MNYWKINRYLFKEQYPYHGPYKTLEEAEEWAIAAALHHTDTFRVFEENGMFHVEQDVP